MSDRIDPRPTALTRRRFLTMMGGATGALALSGLLAACGGDDDDGGATGGDPTATPGTGATGAGSPTTGSSASSPATGGETAPQGELIIGAPQDRHQPESSLPNIGMSIPNPNVFETLVALTPDFEIEPRLAESWEQSGPNTWRFNLRRDVLFHDGSAFTSESVAWTLARVVAAGGGVLGIGEESVAVVDDYTIEITPTKPNVRVPLQLTAPRTGSIFKTGTSITDVRIGTGPFKEVEYVKDEYYEVEAFSDYWGGAPKLAKMTFRFMPDPTTRMLALQAGEVDLVYDVPKESASEVSGSDELQLFTSSVGAYEALSFNIHGAAPYDLGQDPAVREAVALAIDREAIIAGAWQGNAEVNNTMVPAGVLGAAASMIQGPAYDPERAAQILDEAGWVEGSGSIREKDGRQLELTMVVGFPSAEIHRPMPELVQAQLEEVGISLEIVQTPDLGSYEQRLVSLEGDLWAEVGNQVDADPCYLPGLLFYSPTEGGDPESNMYANAFSVGAEFDAFIDACGEASSIEETQEAAAGAMQLLIDELHVVIPIAGIFRLYGVSDKVIGFEAHPVQFVQRWENVSVEED